MLRLKLLEIECAMKLHFYHVAGTRIIDQEADILSMGNPLEGVMLGYIILYFVPLHKGVV